jgi:hypothetical protein
MIELDPALYEAWVAMASNGKAADREAPPNRAQLALEEEGLLMRLPADPDRALRRLDPMLLTASGIGAGNSPVYPRSFVIVSQERRPLVLVDGPTYAVWSRAGAGTTFGSACRMAGEDLGDVALVSRAFMMSLPILLSCAVVFIEPRTGRIG